MKPTLLFICLFGKLFLGYSQSLHSDHQAPHASLKGKHQVQFMLGHSLITESFKDGKNDWMAVPSFAFDYHYWVSNQIALGVHNDVIAENFVVTSSEGALLERHRPVSSVLSMVFKPKKHSHFIFGFGQEFSRDHHFNITRLGYDYAIDIPHGAELNFGITYDIKGKAYDILTVGIGLSKWL